MRLSRQTERYTGQAVKGKPVDSEKFKGIIIAGAASSKARGDDGENAREEREELLCERPD